MNIDEADVVIIGAGAGGGSCAWALANAGVKVALLDAGPHYDPFTDYQLDKPNWEMQGFPPKPRSEGAYSFAPMQPIENDDLRSWNHVRGHVNRSQSRQGRRYHHVRGIGGSTLHFTGEVHRFHPHAMQMGSRFGVAADWPLTYAELEPFYQQAEEVIGVAGPATDSVRYRSQAYPLPAHEPSYASKKLREAGARTGLNWVENSVGALSQSYDGRPACNYCGGCNHGCPRTDKGSVDVTFIRKALATGRCHVFANTEVLRLIAGDNDRITAVECVDACGHTFRVQPKVLVVACGAVQTPRLLLLSHNASAPNGIGNETGHVGRHFMETLFWMSAGLHPEALGSHRGLPSDIICWDYNAPDAIPGVIGGCRFSPATAETGLAGPAKYAQRVLKGWGVQHKQALRKVFGRALAVGSIGEFLPNEKTYIDLDPGKSDVYGRPLARIHSWLADGEIQRLNFMAGKCREILTGVGVETLFEEYGSYDMFSATHVFGTTRMGNDPETSVVDNYGRSHRWKNLFIADASIFPSSGGGEAPSLTIEALAIRSAAHIRRLLARREV